MGSARSRSLSVSSCLAKMDGGGDEYVDCACQKSEGQKPMKGRQAKQEKATSDLVLIERLRAVEHHIEVIDTKDGKVERLKSLVHIYHILNSRQMLVVAVSSNIPGIEELLSQLAGGPEHRKLDF